MKQELFKYLRSNFPQKPELIDRLIVSAYLERNGFLVGKNKLLKHYKIIEADSDFDDLKKLLSILDNLKIDLSFENLIQVFEFVISPADRVITGAVYTPLEIREYIVDQVIANKDLSSVRIADFACGCGGFLLTVAKKLKEQTGKTYKEIFKENIYGLDIQTYAVNRSKLLLSLLAISEGEKPLNFQFNFYRGNALNFQWSDLIVNYKGFDIVLGNPPYVCSRNIDKESKQYISNWKVSSSGHPDLYIPFFQIGVENLKKNGTLGYITMNTFFKSVNGRALRQYFEEEELTLRILDFGSNQIFQSKSTYTCICIIKKDDSEVIKYAKVNPASLNEGVNYEKIYWTKLNHKNGWNLQQIDLLNKIEKIGTPFGELYRTRNGIATLKNHIYIFDPIDEDDDYFYLQNGSIFPVEKGICKDIINPNKLTQIEDIDELKKKVIFPYVFDEDDPVILGEEEFRDQFPLAFSYLEAKRSVLATRDKGKGIYDSWYAYGRNQCLEKYPNKLFFPHITATVPNYAVSADEELLFYNGIAVVSEDIVELQFLQKLMSSNLFWFYIRHSSKPYGAGYFSLSRNYIKNFGIYDFSQEQKEFICNERNSIVLNEFIESIYGIELKQE